MSHQNGRAGMGSHKHGVSGRVPTNKTNAMRRSREANREIQENQKLKKARKGRMADSVKELL